MNREWGRIPLMALILGLFWGGRPFLAASVAPADNNSRWVNASMCRSYPRQEADLVKWLRQEMIPGRATQEDIFAAFGRRFRHPFDGFGQDDHSIHYDAAAFVYDLDDLGVHAHAPHHVLVFRFDPRSGALLRAVVEEEERQTGFHLDVSPEQ